MQALENTKNNPSGKLHNQETLLAVIKKQKAELDKQRKQIFRMEKDCERYKNELKIVKDFNN